LLLATTLFFLLMLVITLFVFFGRSYLLANRTSDFYIWTVLLLFDLFVVATFPLRVLNSGSRLSLQQQTQVALLEAQLLSIDQRITLLVFDQLLARNKANATVSTVASAPSSTAPDLPSFASLASPFAVSSISSPTLSTNDIEIKVRFFPSFERFLFG
jgi:hypothetical protein